jgi:hypothetical protein
VLDWSGDSGRPSASGGPSGANVLTGSIAQTDHPGLGPLRARRLDALHGEVLEADALDRTEHVEPVDVGNAIDAC